MRSFIALFFSVFASLSWAEEFVFPSVDGGEINISKLQGKAILVVNTASQCGFTRQYRGMQELQNIYAKRGLVVLAVPSDDFNQELDSNEAVKSFCELNYNLTLPMSEITKVRGDDAHPFYKWVFTKTGFEPKWNFNKVLIGPDGSIQGTFGSLPAPLSRRITTKIEGLLGEKSGL